MGTEYTVPRSCQGPSGFGDHHASTGGPMMLTVFVTNKKPLP